MVAMKICLAISTSFNIILGFNVLRRLAALISYRTRKWHRDVREVDLKFGAKTCSPKPNPGRGLAEILGGEVGRSFLLTLWGRKRRQPRKGSGGWRAHPVYN